MRKKKTPWNKRQTYKFLDEEGREFHELKVEPNGLNDITLVKELIKKLHSMDDHDVYIESKEMKLPKYLQDEVKRMREEYVRRFSEEYGYPPKNDEIPINLHREYLSLEDTPGDDDDSLGDSSKIEEAIATRPFDDEPETAVERMRTLVEGFTDREKQVYELCFKEGLKYNRAAEVLEISEVRVGQIAKDIRKKLSQDAELKRHFRVI